MSKGTPGPWRFEKDVGHPPCRFIHADTFDEIALLRGGHDWEVQDANAKLIAAAPELLEALQAIVRHQDLMGGDMSEYSTIRVIAAAAIKKALE